MHIKPGVNLNDISPQMQMANAKAQLLWLAFGQTLVITSGREGGHRRRSKHYEGNACDYRTRYFDYATKSVVASTLAHILGDDYDVVVEPTHIHTEYDPD